VNVVNVYLFVETMPFGGVGPSGMGHYYGKYGFDMLTHTKSMLISPPDVAIDHLFPPDERRAKDLVRVLSSKSYGKDFSDDIGTAALPGCTWRTEDTTASSRISRFLHNHNYPKAKTAIVWDAIALHTAPEIANRREPEVALFTSARLLTSWDFGRRKSHLN
jgi:hypothetical protein